MELREKVQLFERDRSRPAGGGRSACGLAKGAGGFSVLITAL